MHQAIAQGGAPANALAGGLFICLAAHQQLCHPAIPCTPCDGVAWLDVLYVRYSASLGVIAVLEHETTLLLGTYCLLGSACSSYL
jgi:hypothetical protein